MFFCKINAIFKVLAGNFFAKSPKTFHSNCEYKRQINSKKIYIFPQKVQSSSGRE